MCIRDSSEIEALGEHYQDFVVAKDALTASVNAENPICGIMDDMPVETIQMCIRDRAEGAVLDDAARKKALDQEITVLSTDMPVFEAALKIHGMLS